MSKFGGDLEKAISIWQNAVKNPGKSSKRAASAKKHLSNLELYSMIPSSVKDIPQDLNVFYQELSRKIRDKEDSIATAAWALVRIGEIHPFPDANGRTGRLLMNAILMDDGYAPVIFDSDDEYTDALTRNGKEPGYFAQFLAETIEKTAKKIESHHHGIDLGVSASEMLEQRFLY